MRKSVAAALVLALSIIPAGAATAHQPVFLLPTDTTPNAGPLLVDGTVSFAKLSSCCHDLHTTKHAQQLVRRWHE